MIKTYRKIYSIYIIVDFVLMAVSFYLPYLLKYNSLKDIASGNLNLMNFQEYTFVYLVWMASALIFFKKYSLFTTERSLSIPKEVFRVFSGVFLSGLLMNAIIFFLQYKFFSRGIFIKNCLFLFLFLSLWRTIKRLILRCLISKGFHNINVILIGANLAAKAFLEETKKMPWAGFKVIGILDNGNTAEIPGVQILGKEKDFFNVAKRYFIDEAIICGTPKIDTLREFIDKSKNLKVGIRVIPENFLEPVPITNISYLGIIPIITYKENNHQPLNIMIKSLFDLLISLILLTTLSPIFIIIAILIKLGSKGPIFYIQRRVGLRGKTFNFYKFRSMVENADKLKTSLLDKNEVKDGVIFKMKVDPRITKIGRYLRKYSLDELPQLFNVLRGDMSLVGPRPPTEDEVMIYKDHYMQRLSVKPGITGLAQIKGRSDLSFYNWVRWDSWYINNWSFGLDLKILWLTLPAVIKGRGAY